MTDDNNTERRGPGRPRVPEVIDRDEKVLGVLQNDGASQVRDIADKLNLAKNAVYLSLWRLRREGKVVYERSGAKRVWESA